MSVKDLHFQVLSFQCYIHSCIVTSAKLPASSQESVLLLSEDDDDNHDGVKEATSYKSHLAWSTATR